MGFVQYLKDTRGELNHVAWPTRVQTLVYTILVVTLSILISLYLGFFDFAFTTGLGKLVEMYPGASTPQITEPIIVSTSTESLDDTITIE
jgi:preprotein translocase SecE subunit